MMGGGVLLDDLSSLWRVFIDGLNKYIASFPYPIYLNEEFIKILLAKTLLDNGYKVYPEFPLGKTKIDMVVFHNTKLVRLIEIKSFFRRTKKGNKSKWLASILEDIIRCTMLDQEGIPGIEIIAIPEKYPESGRPLWPYFEINLMPMLKKGAELYIHYFNPHRKHVGELIEKYGDVGFRVRDIQYSEVHSHAIINDIKAIFLYIEVERLKSQR